MTIAYISLLNKNKVDIQSESLLDIFKLKYSELNLLEKSSSYSLSFFLIRNHIAMNGANVINTSEIKDIIEETISPEPSNYRSSIFNKQVIENTKYDVKKDLMIELKNTFL